MRKHPRLKYFLLRFYLPLLFIITNALFDLLELKIKVDLPINCLVDFFASVIWSELGFPSIIITFACSQCDSVSELSRSSARQCQKLRSLFLWS